MLLARAVVVEYHHVFLRTTANIIVQITSYARHFQNIYIVGIGRRRQKLRVGDGANVLRRDDRVF